MTSGSYFFFFLLTKREKEERQDTRSDPGGPGLLRARKPALRVAGGRAETEPWTSLALKRYARKTRRRRRRSWRLARCYLRRDRHFYFEVDAGQASLSPFPLEIYATPESKSEKEVGHERIIVPRAIIVRREK